MSHQEKFAQVEKVFADTANAVKGLKTRVDASASTQESNLRKSGASPAQAAGLTKAQRSDAEVKRAANGQFGSGSGISKSGHAHGWRSEGSVGGHSVGHKVRKTGEWDDGNEHEVEHVNAKEGLVSLKGDKKKTWPLHTISASRSDAGTKHGADGRFTGGSGGGSSGGDPHRGTPKTGALGANWAKPYESMGADYHQSKKTPGGHHARVISDHDKKEHTVHISKGSGSAQRRAGESKKFGTQAEAHQYAESQLKSLG